MFAWILAVVLAAGSDDATRLAVEPSSVDFGIVAAHSEHQVELTVRNQSIELVTFVATGSDCDCLSSKLEAQALVPRTSATWRVTFSTCDNLGAARRSVWLTDAAGQTLLRVPVHYETVPSIYASPGFVSFGLVDIDGDQPVRTQVKVYSFSEKPVRLTRVTTWDAHIEADISQPILAAGQPGVVELRLLPNQTAGALSQTLWIETDSPEMPRLRLPVTAELMQGFQSEQRGLAFDRISHGQAGERTVTFRLTKDAKLISARSCNDDVDVAHVERGEGTASVTFRSNPKLPPGRFGGFVEFETEQGGRIRKARLPYWGYVAAA